MEGDEILVIKLNAKIQMGYQLILRFSFHD
jgi:hypothetical protein